MAGYHDNKNTFYVGEFDGAFEENIIIPLTTAVKHQSELRNGYIDLYINSYGGNTHLLNHTVELIELAKRDGVTVRTIVTGAAYSAGSMLAVAGTPGHRYISKYARHMVHYGHVSTGANSTPLQLERSAAAHDAFFKSALAHYERYAEIPDLRENMVDDQWYISAQQARKWGMADHFLDKFTLNP